MSATATETHLPSRFMAALDNAAARTLPRIAVIDDDPLFGRIMQQIGKKVGLEIMYLKDFKTLDGFDVAIVDYQLENMTGLDVGRQAERFMGSLPIILVSRTNLPRSGDWPSSIREFVCKETGPYAILEAAVAALGD